MSMSRSFEQRRGQDLGDRMTRVEERLNHIDEKLEDKFKDIHKKLDEIKDSLNHPVSDNTRKISEIEKREIKSSGDNRIQRILIIVSLSTSLVALGFSKAPFLSKILTLF